MRDLSSSHGFRGAEIRAAGSSQATTMWRRALAARRPLTGAHVGMED
jgi:hypothetical protein